MVALSDLTFLARGLAGGIKNVAGSAVTVALATLAKGLHKHGNIDIDATGPSTTTVQIYNSTPGQSSGLNVSGNVEASGNVSGTGIFSYNSNVVMQSNGSTQSITLTGNPTGNRVVTFPDSDITIGAGSGYLGSYTQAALNAIVPSGFAWAFCNNIAGNAGGTTGVPAYYTPVTGLWLRFATDGPI